MTKDHQTEIDSREAIARHNVLGVGISSLNLDQTVVKILDTVKERGNVGFVTVTGVHGVMESQDDEELKKIHNQSYISTADGMPMVWLGKWNGVKDMGRVYGPDLMLRIIDEGRERELKHYFFGGDEGVADELRKKLCERFEKLEVVGVNCPPFRPLNETEKKQLIAEILEKQPHCLWVGLSTPKQEIFMHSFIKEFRKELESLPHGILFFGVGAAFDFHAGKVTQAPKCIQKSGMEWAFRLCMEPRRLWKRYVFNNSKFLLKIFPQMMGLKNYKIEK